MILVAYGDRLEVYVRDGVDDLSPRHAFLAVALPNTPAEDRTFLDHIIREQPAGVYLRGARNPADIEKISTLLRVAEAKLGAKPEPLEIIAAIDTPEAGLAIASFNRPVPRLAALAFDPAGLAAACGAAIGSPTISAVRAVVPLAARASGAVACMRLDHIHDRADSLEDAYIRAREDGFSAFVTANGDDARDIGRFSAT